MYLTYIASNLQGDEINVMMIQPIVAEVHAVFQPDGYLTPSFFAGTV